MGIDIVGGHPSMDYAEHVATYRGFLKFTQYAIMALVILLAGMAYFLV
jgi:hypothetical protein